MLLGVDVGDGAAADDGGHAVREQLAPDGEHARRAGAADELVRRQHDGVLVGERVLAGGATMSMSTYGPAAAKSQTASAPWRCSRAEMP